LASNSMNVKKQVAFDERKEIKGQKSSGIALSSKALGWQEMIDEAEMSSEVLVLNYSGLCFL